MTSEPRATALRLRGGYHAAIVLVQFWTYTCINWLRTLPYVRARADKYTDRGLALIGVHTPEFEFEADLANVRRALKELRVEYPIAVDNDYAIWRAFGNRYWPALYLIDGRGHVPHRHFGESDYEQSERIIQELPAGVAGGIAQEPGSVVPRGAEAPADWANLESPETYLDSERSENRVSSGARLRLNHWALGGDWTVQRQAVVLNETNGRIAYRFHARDLNLVMAPRAQGRPVRFRVLIDGHPPGAAHGLDVDEQGIGVVAEPRMYQLIRQPGPVADRHFEIQFLDPGVEVFMFTFG